MVLGSRVALGSGVVLGCFWGGWWLVASGWWLVAGGWRLVAGGWWLGGGQGDVWAFPPLSYPLLLLPLLLQPL